MAYFKKGGVLWMLRNIWTVRYIKQIGLRKDILRKTNPEEYKVNGGMILKWK